MLTHGPFFKLMEVYDIPWKVLEGGSKRKRFWWLCLNLDELLFSSAFDDLVHFWVVKWVNFVVDQPEDILADFIELSISKKSGRLHVCGNLLINIDSSNLCN